MNGPVLVISRSVPPEPSGSAVIVGNLAKQFSSSEMILAGEEPCDRPPVAWHRDWPELCYVAKGIPKGRRGARTARRLQTPLIVARCVRLARKHRCSAIVAVFPIEEYLFAAYIAAKATGARFFPYFHNTYADNRSGPSAAFASWLQSRVFARAEHTFVMSQGMAELYGEKYPGVACSPLVHSFNETIPEFAPPPPPANPMKLTLCGSINESCRDASVRLCQAIADTPSTRLTLLTGTPRNYLASHGMLRDGVAVDTVSRDHVLQRLAEADIVLIPHGFTGQQSEIEYRTIFPTRVIEALICGRPILAHSPPDSFLTRFLRQHDCAKVVDQPSKESIRDAIEVMRCDDALRSRLVHNALDAAKQFQAQKVATSLRAFFER